MKRKSSFSLGPGASSLILIFVVLNLTVLGMLALMTARNDLRFSQRSAEVIEAVYTLDDQAQRHAAEITALARQNASGAGDGDALISALSSQLPDGFAADGNAVTWQESDGERVLDCALGISLIDGQVTTDWLRHTLTSTIGDGIGEEFDD